MPVGEDLSAAIVAQKSPAEHKHNLVSRGLFFITAPGVAPRAAFLPDGDDLAL